MSSYFEVIFEGVHKDLEDELSGICFEHGAQGVMENLDFHQMRDDYAPELIPKDFKVIVAYFEEKPSSEFIKIFETKFTDIKVSLKEEESKDWLEEWKKDFVAFSLAGDYWVVPSWLEAPAEAKKYLSIDPGMAFGTGTHETTQLASELLWERKDKEFQSLESTLDVGTGTGILAMIARAEFSERVVTTEIDADARVVARENFAKNNFKDIELPDYQIEDVNETFDLVIANIIDGVLTKLKSELIRCTNQGGYLILTGILQERDKAFIDGFLKDTNLEILERKVKGEWVGYLLKK